MYSPSPRLLLPSPQFGRDILGAKLAERGGTEFRPEEVTDWLRNCYTEATAMVDEHGIIHGKSVDEAAQSLPEQLMEARKKMEGMQKLLDASSTIATLDPLQATENIVSETCRILGCDRSSIFTLDEVRVRVRVRVHVRGPAVELASRGVA